MARGTQHIRKRPQPDARQQAKRRGRRKPNVAEEVLFFERLRRQARWVFVLLALVFGFGFVVFGVGSGSTGIGDALQNALKFGNHSPGSGIGKLQKQTRRHPRDAAAFRRLATALETKQRNDEAIAALERYTALRPKDQDGLRELAGLYTRKAQGYRTDARNAQVQASSVSPAGTFAPASTTPLGKAFADPTALQDPVAQAVQTQAQAQASDSFSKLQAVEQQATATYRKLIALTPADATLQIQLADAAQSSGDQKTAIAAYKKFLELAPNDPLAPAVKRVLKQLTNPSPLQIAHG